MRIVADIETDGLLDQLTKVHCLVLRERGSRELLLSCTDDPRGREMGYAPIKDGLQLLSEAEKIYFHNGIGFDIPALQKVYPEWTYRGELVDTLVVASFRFAHIKEKDFDHINAAIRAGKKPKIPTHLAGRQSLEAWGHRLGIHKGEYTDWCKQQGIEDAWSEWRPEMQTYCELDTEVGDAVADHLGRSGIPVLASEIEHELAWYLAQQERNGWPFDMEKAINLQAKLAARREEIVDKLKDEFGWWYEANGETLPKRTIQYKVSKTRSVPELIVEGAPYTKLKQVEFNPNSRQHIAKVLIERYGWKPRAYTPSGQPKVDDATLEAMTNKVSGTLQEYLMLQKRLGQIAEGDNSWLAHATDLGHQGGAMTGMMHIHGRVWQNNCVTHRASHSSPNVAQVPSSSSEYGTECRECYTVPEGWVLIGSDAAGLELRCLAHYMAAFDNGAYGKAILEGDKDQGTDIHSINRDALRSAGYLKLTRDDGKTFIYAYLYGAGDTKLGSIIAPGAPKSKQKKIGKALRAAFETKIPALGKLSKSVKKKIARGWLGMPDGRRTYIRHEHAALNSLLQAAGAIICKAWIVEFNRRLCERYGSRSGGGWDQQWAALGWIHDEVQIAVRPEIADEVKEILIASIRHITDVFSWRLPLDGDAQVGPDWSHTH